MDVDTDKIDDAVLALLHLTLHDGPGRASDLYGLTVISDRAELDTFARRIPGNLDRVFSIGQHLQKSRAKVEDFRDKLCAIYQGRFVSVSGD